MKNVLFFAVFLVLSGTVFAQIPQAIKYQAVARDTNGAVIASQNISLKISILGDSVTGVVEYSETHSVMTNSFGLVNVAISALEDSHRGITHKEAFIGDYYDNTYSDFKLWIDAIISGAKTIVYLPNEAKQIKKDKKKNN
jgi:hypothetical protein